MKAGRLDRRITIERMAETVNEFGTLVTSWTPVGTVAAQRVDQSTDEFMRSFGEEASTVVVFRVRYRAGVLMTDRVSYEGRTFDLIELKEIGRREGLELRCEASR